MKRFAIILTALLVLASALPAQEWKGKGRLIGFVFDQNNKPLEGVRVKLFFTKVNAGLDVVSDKEGKWTAAWLRGGGWNIDFEKSGYTPLKKSFEVNEYGKNPELRVNMQKVEGLVVTDELKTALTQANELFDQKNYPGALDAYNAILVKFPDAYPIWKNIGNCFFALEQYDKAEDAFRKILDKEPQNTDALVLVGNTYANRGQADKAMEWYGKVELDKIKDSTVLFNIGTSFYNLSKFEEALKYYRRAVEIQSNNTDALYQLGLIYLNLQKNAEAIASFESFLKFDADSPKAGQVKSFLDYLKKKIA
jgi:tetratricopeptide (TPR) repeat protein